MCVPPSTQQWDKIYFVRCTEIDPVTQEVLRGFLLFPVSLYVSSGFLQPPASPRHFTPALITHWTSSASTNTPRHSSPARFIAPAALLTLTLAVSTRAKLKSPSFLFQVLPPPRFHQVNQKKEEKAWTSSSPVTADQQAKPKPKSVFKQTFCESGFVEL